MKHEFTVIVRAPKKYSRDDVRGALVDALGDETPLLVLGDYFGVNNYEGFGLAVKKEPRKSKRKDAL